MSCPDCDNTLSIPEFALGILNEHFSQYERLGGVPQKFTKQIVHCPCGRFWNVHFFQGDITAEEFLLPPDNKEYSGAIGCLS